MQLGKQDQGLELSVAEVLDKTLPRPGDTRLYVALVFGAAHDEYGGVWVERDALERFFTELRAGGYEPVRVEAMSPGEFELTLTRSPARAEVAGHVRLCRHRVEEDPLITEGSFEVTPAQFAELLAELESTLSRLA